MFDANTNDRPNHALKSFESPDGIVHVLLEHAVGQQDHRHLAVLLLDFLLHDRLDVDAALRQDARHLGQHARMILSLDTQVVGAFAGFDRQDRVGRQRVRLERQVRHAVLRVAGHGANHVNQVGDHRRSGRLHAGAGAVEQGRTCRVAVDHHRVHHAIDVGDQTIGRDQRRVYTQLDTGRGAARYAQVLDAVAQGFGVIHVGGGQLGDAFGVGLVELQRDPEGNGSQDRQLVGRIDTFHVKGRIGFGITQRLGFSQYVRERAAFFAHFGQDEVAGAIDDPGYPVDAVRRQAFTDGLDHRDAACNGRFERHNHAFFLGLGEDFIAVHGNQRLVGSDYVLAVLDGFEHQFASNGIAAHQLNDDVDFWIGGDFEYVGRGWGTGNLAARVWRTNGNLRHFNPTPGTTSDFLGVTFKYVEGTSTNGTQPTDAYFDRFHYELPIKRPTQGRPWKTAAMEHGSLLMGRCQQTTPMITEG